MVVTNPYCGSDIDDEKTETTKKSVLNKVQTALILLCYGPV